MPVLAYTKRFNTGDVAAGGTFEKTYTVTEHYTLHRIYIHERTTTNMRKCLFHLEVGARNIFADDIPVRELGDYDWENMELNEDCPAGTVIRMIFSNGETAAVNADIILKFTQPGT